MERLKVTFYPDNKTIEVLAQTSVLQAAFSAGIYLNSSCGGEGVCGRCKVILKKGKVDSDFSVRLSPEERAKGIFLACLTRIQTDAEFEIPLDSRLNLDVELNRTAHLHFEKDYSEVPESEATFFDKAKEHFTLSPLVKKIFLRLPPPTLEDRISDWERIQRELILKHNFTLQQCPLFLLRQLGRLLSRSNWAITLTVGEFGGRKELLNIEANDTSAKNFGVVFDIGTTTISGQLVDLNSARILGTKLTYNKQMRFGSDVISRIIYASKENGLTSLYEAVIMDINQMIKEFISENDLDLNEITCCVCAGNTTMIHLLLQIDPANIRRQPYNPTVNMVPILKAREAGVMINPRGLLYCVPGVANYVGGDITAGVIFSGMYEKEGLGLLIDIGTNGELVLGNREFLISCAASAGPAFEGSGLVSGVRAGQGAIQNINIDLKNEKVAYSTIGGGKPIGICGSGFVDLIAELLRVGLLEKNGKFKPLGHPRIREGKEGREFVLVEGKYTMIGKDIIITESDIENIKRAKAAIFAASATLLRKLGLSWTDLKMIYIAGGFGTALNIENAMAIGLFPDIGKEKITFIGNSSLGGAKSMLCSIDAFNTAQEIAKKISYLELSLEPDYMDEYMAALFFPHTDISKFYNFC